MPCKDWSYTAPNQGTKGCWKMGQEQIDPLGPSEGTWPCHSLHLGMLNFRTMRQKIFIV